MRHAAIFVLTTLSAVHARAQVVTSEFLSDPASEGWPLFQQYCAPGLWIEDGVYRQSLNFDACGAPPPPGGGEDTYLRDVSEYNGSAAWFYEFRVETNGDRSEIPGGGATTLAAGNFFGENFKANVARDQVKLLVSNPFSVSFFDIAPGIPHTIRLELNNVESLSFAWFIDGVLVRDGAANDVFPSDDARVVWQGKAWMLPCENAWYYIRYGVIPVALSGDFDSDGDRDERDAFYFAECVAERGNGPGITTDPGCPWADMDADGDVDFADFGAFQRAFTGSDE